MDFFANAFVTRDVVDPENVVVKDGIQLRENAISSLSNDIVNCEVCGITTAKYKCPGCFCQTCSLKCSKQHKLDTTCSGTRSRTHFVERKQYNEQDMMSDYNFLEEVGRTVDNAARDNLKRDAGLNPNKKRTFGANNTNSNKKGRNNQHKNGSEAQDGGEGGVESVTKLSLSAAQELEKQGSEGSGSYRDKQLIMQAKKRSIHLIRMADGLKKRKENSTHWRDKPSRILWTVEWLFPEVESSRRVLVHKNDESKTFQELLSGLLIENENKDLLEKYPVDSLEQLQLFFVIPLRHANQPALYPLNKTDSLRDALKFKKVLEYPTILILGPNLSTLETRAESTEIPTSTSIDSTNPSSDNINTTVTTAAATIESIKNSCPILEKYTIEEPPTQWPNRSTNNNNPETQQGQKDNKKRPNETTEENKKDSKKIKVDDEEEEEVEVELEEEEESSDDSDSDSNSDSDSDSDDSSSEESDDGDDDIEIGDDSVVDSENLTVNTGVETDEADLKIGQAILEAFNQDFGGTE